MMRTELKIPAEDVCIYGFKKENGLIALMDCGGSNVVKINEQIPSIVRMIATARINHPEVKARMRAEELHVPLVELDLRTYEENNGVARGDYLKAIKDGDTAKFCGSADYTTILSTRDSFYDEFMNKLYSTMTEHNISKSIPIFAAGFMQLITASFLNNYFIVNVHPGDLTRTVKNETGKKRVYIGDAWRPSALAIDAGEERLYSSIHLMTEVMDQGPVFMRGYPLNIDQNFISKLFDMSDKKIRKFVGSTAQNALKYLGDHVIAGATFQDLFEGKWGSYKNAPETTLCYKFKNNWYLVPNGIKIENHVENNPDTIFRRDEKFIELQNNNFYNTLLKYY